MTAAKPPRRPHAGPSARRWTGGGRVKPQGGKPAGRFQRPPRAGSAAEAADGPLILYGLHPVRAALANPRRAITALWATDNARMRIADAIAERANLGGAGLPEAQGVRPSDLDKMLGADAVHQGVAAEVEPLDVPALGDVLTPGCRLIVLDQVTDPHNVGAIVRTAAAFGVHGLIMTERHSPPLGGVLAKSASGGLELVPIVLVKNLARALAALGEAGVLRLGLDSAAEGDLETAIADRPTEPPIQGVALVLGAEGKGLRQLTRETCDALCRLTLPGAIVSLNVSNAAAIALYALSRARG